jgi:pyruvate dehydrogenase E1 component beta subunit
VTPGTPADAKGLLKAAIRDDDPVVFMEGELLYNLKGEVPDDDDFVIPLGVADLKREGSDVSIITHGKMIQVALQAAKKLEKDGIEADVLDLRTIRPLDMDAILSDRREDEPGGIPRGGMALRGNRCADRLHDPGGGVRPPGRAYPARHSGGHPDAVREEPREPWPSPRPTT